jgi:hypothetical protein
MSYRIPKVPLGGRRLKIKPAQHLEIKAKYESMTRCWGVRRLDVLAEEYGVHRSTISRHIHDHVKFPMRADHGEQCNYGHKLTPENTYIHKRGFRECRTCRREHNRIRVQQKIQVRV